MGWYEAVSKQLRDKSLPPHLHVLVQRLYEWRAKRVERKLYVGVLDQAMWAIGRQSELLREAEHLIFEHHSAGVLDGLRAGQDCPVCKKYGYEEWLRKVSSFTEPYEEHKVSGILAAKKERSPNGI